MSNLSHDIIVKLIFERLGKNEEDKLNEIEPYTDIEKVRKIANKMNLNMVYPSTRKDKKYMIRDPLSRKFVHFGQNKMFDFTRHMDIDRKNKFKNRNKKWADAEPYSPSFLSYYLLWT
jgi:hypothetical protein